MIGADYDDCYGGIEPTESVAAETVSVEPPAPEL